MRTIGCWSFKAIQKYCLKQIFAIFWVEKTMDNNFKMIITFFKMENVLNHNKKIMISKSGLNAIFFAWSFISILCSFKTKHLHWIT
jgi:hypothetical protein